MEEVLYLMCPKAGAPTPGSHSLYPGLSSVPEGPASGIQFSQGPPHSHLGISPGRFQTLGVHAPHRGTFPNRFGEDTSPDEAPCSVLGPQPSPLPPHGTSLQATSFLFAPLPLLEGRFSGGYHLGMTRVRTAGPHV